MNPFAKLTGVLCFAFASCVAASAVTLVENFSTDPFTRGWSIFGNTNLFQWDSTNQKLRVTWDSAQTNSYFHLPLGTILSRRDDFAMGFDLMLDDYVIGSTPGKLGTFETAIGCLNLEQATRTNFFRGAGVNATYGPKNLVEFNFFPAFDSFLPTIGQVIVSTNNSWLYNDSNRQEMTPGETFRVFMSYVAATRTLSTVISNNALQYGLTQTISVPTNFDFRVATFSVSSYSDAIQPPPPGSIRAHGTVDNITITMPPPPVMNLTGAFSNGLWRVQFLSRSNWLYALERSLDFQPWTNASALIAGNATNLVLSDANPPSGRALYRVRAQYP